MTRHRVRIPSPLLSYTGQQSDVEAEGETLGALLLHLDQTYKGLRFRIIDEQDRIRPHIKIFLGTRMAVGLEEVVPEGEGVMIVAALSGG